MMIEVKITDEKTCTKCKSIKLKTEFGNSKRGLLAKCKSCCYNDLKEYRLKNPDKVKNYPSNNKDLTLKRANNWKLNNPERFNSLQKAYREKHREKLRLQSSDYHYKNKKRLNKKSRDYAKNNREKVYNKQKEWKENNKQYMKEYYKKYHEEKLKTNPLYKLNSSISSQIRQVLNKKTKSWKISVDFSIEDLRSHLESKFTKGMTWDNYGKKGWEIDHIIPKSLFKYDSVDHAAFKACWSLSNLQPLWSTTEIAMKYGESKTYKGNSNKGNKIKITKKIQSLLNKVNNDLLC